MNEHRMKRKKLFEQVDLYPVTGREHSVGRSTEHIVEAILKAGCRIFQLREKNLSKREYHLLAKKIRAMTPDDVLMFCNDHIDVALAVGADGVHLGQDDLPIEAARALAPDLLIGASSHNVAEALSAQKAGADYVNIGPIFSTKTKVGASEFLGPRAIEEISSNIAIPFTVMGGIKKENIAQVLSAGARRVAVVTAVTAAGDPRRAAQELRATILGFHQADG